LLVFAAGFFFAAGFDEAVLGRAVVFFFGFFLLLASVFALDDVFRFLRRGFFFGGASSPTKLVMDGNSFTASMETTCAAKGEKFNLSIKKAATSLSAEVRFVASAVRVVS